MPALPGRKTTRVEVEIHWIDPRNGIFHASAEVTDDIPDDLDGLLLTAWMIDAANQFMTTPPRNLPWERRPAYL